MEAQLSLEFLRVVEQAAISAAHTMGLGDGHKADEAAVKAMRATMDTVGMDGTIVIGEGERDDAPMLFIGEKVGAAEHDTLRAYPIGRYRRRSARRHESLRHRAAGFHHRAGRERARRIAQRAGPLHGKNYRGAVVQRRGRSRRARWRTICARLPSVWTGTLMTWW